MSQETVNEAKLNAFMGKLVGDLGATMSSALVIIGDRLGLYKALAEAPADAKELAARTGTQARYVEEWLNAQAAAGYLEYDSAAKKYVLPPEQRLALADESSPAFFPGAFQLAQAMFASEEKAERYFKEGGGLSWGDQHPCLFEGTERFFRPGYAANLIGQWLPALDGMIDKLTKGAKVADVGCGLGAPLILMAKAFPNSKFYGFDSHAGSIELARKRAAAAGVGDRITYQTAPATQIPGSAYDLIAFFDCLHDMEDPVGAAREVRRALSPDGTWMIVEPFASDKLEENHNPVGRVYYSASTMLCVPHSLAHHGPGLGAQAGEARLREVIAKGGQFSRIRQVIASPFNMVLEARI